MPRKKKERSPLPGALIFSIIAVLVFCGGAAYFVKSVLDPYGTQAETKVNTPYLIGLYYSQVIADPAYAEFNIVEGEYVYNESVDAGKIIEQTPESGRKMDVGDTITVNISRGAKTFRLPDYENMEARQVKIELERLGVICIEATPEFNDDIPSGYVLRTDPVADTELTAGDTVTLTVSKGPEIVLVEMPDLMGCSESEALTLLEAAGLSWEPITYEEYDGIPGQVIFQSVEAHTEVEKGTIIAFTVSIAPVPDVTITYPVKLVTGLNLANVVVMVDGATVYTGTHDPMMGGTVQVSLTARQGEHTIDVYQNGVFTARETVVF